MVIIISTAVYSVQLLLMKEIETLETKDINYIFTKKSDAADSWHENPLECVLDGQNVARNITSA